MAARAGELGGGIERGPLDVGHMLDDEGRHRVDDAARVRERVRDASEEHDTVDGEADGHAQKTSARKSKPRAPEEDLTESGNASMPARRTPPW